MSSRQPRPPGMIAALLLLVPVVVLVVVLFSGRRDSTRLLRLVPAARAGEISCTFEHKSWDPRHLSKSPPPRNLPAILEETFDGDFTSRWRTARTATDFPSHLTLLKATRPEADPLEPPEVVHEGGNGALRFPSPVGACSTTIEVSPDTPYEVRTLVSVSCPDGPPPAEALVGYVGILELALPLDLTGMPAEQVPLAIKSAHPVRAPHVLPPSATPGVAASLIFKSSVYTRSLIIVLVAGVPGEPRRGSVTFDDLRLTPLPLRYYIPHRRESLADDLPAPRDGQEALPTIKMLGDLRDAFLLPPPASLVLEVRVPGPNPLLEFAYGVPEERVPGFGEHPTTFRVDVIEEGKRMHALFQSTICPSGGVDELGWHENRIDLAPWEGKTIRLRFRTESEPGSNDMAAFGSPIIRPRGGVGNSPPSVVLVSLDTLRADHLELYGYPRPTSPFMSRFFREEGQYFSEFVAASPYTLPSHASILSGQYPATHGVSQFDRRLVAGVHPLLAETLARADYVTAAFTGGGFVGYEYGFREGFDTYTIIDPLLTSRDRYRNRFPRAGDRAFNDAVYDRYDLDRVLEFISRHKEGPFFLFLHTYLIHNYAPPPELAAIFDAENRSDLGAEFDLHEIDTNPGRRAALTEADLAHVKNFYDATIRAADNALARLVDHLRQENLLDRTLLVVTSDHGEEFREHGGLLHGRSLYQHQLSVPFMIRVPWRPERGRVEAIGHHVDVSPTILDLLQLPVPDRMQGQSLRPQLEGIPAEPSPLWSELDAEGLGELQGVRLYSMKLIETPSVTKALKPLRDRQRLGVQLFDLATDPAEAHDLAASGHPALQPLQELLRQLRDRLEREGERARNAAASRFEPSEAQREALRALGYPAGAH
ncbi:MAG: sulfatase [Planctomycetota bacterium]